MTEPQEPRSAALDHLTDEEASECAFSPETAAAGWLEHAEGCARCATEITDLKLVLAQLADLPEPAFPDEVGIRIDAALERAWQEADAERDAAASPVPRRARFSWRRLAVPLGALALIVAAGAGLDAVLNQGVSTSSSATSGSAPNAASAQSSDAALSQWVLSVLPGYSVSTNSMNQSPAHAHASTLGPMEECKGLPQRPGFTVEATSARQFHGREATLVVYQNSEEPASTTVYAVVYAGSCPTSSSEILDQGPVSR